MPDPQTLGVLASHQELTWSLVDSADAALCRTQTHPDLGPLGWYLGRAVFLEAWWLRGQVLEDTHFSPVVRDLFTPGITSLGHQGDALPPKKELLAWARGIQEETLGLLANPARLPPHPLLEGDFLLHFFIQEYALAYESMVQVLTEGRAALGADTFTVRNGMHAVMPVYASEEVARGHFRIGANDPNTARDNEVPPQAVQLDAFRIATTPVTNAHWLAFMQADGYAGGGWWDEEGEAWRGSTAAEAPAHWFRDDNGQWYAIGVNGPYELAGDATVSGVNYYEASAFAAWAASLGGELQGAILPHEYQWEIGRRVGYLQDTGRVLEWCRNPFHPYPGFQPRPDEQVSAAWFDGGYQALRGASLHTRPVLRRASFRHYAPRAARYLFSGVRLVLPPS